MTEDGQITILPGHEPLLSVVRPGILSLVYQKDSETFDEEYVTGGGVVTITENEVILAIDSIDAEKDLSDAEEIERKKREAELHIANYSAENPTPKSQKERMELEYEYLKYAAMQELIKNSSYSSSTSRL